MEGSIRVSNVAVLCWYVALVPNLAVPEVSVILARKVRPFALPTKNANRPQVNFLSLNVTVNSSALGVDRAVLSVFLPPPYTRLLALSVHRAAVGADSPVPGVHYLAHVVGHLASTVDRLAVSVDRLAVSVDRLAVSVDRLALTVDRLALNVEYLALNVDRLALSVDRLAVSVDYPALNVDHLALDVDRLGLRLAAPSLNADHLALYEYHPATSVDSPVRSVGLSFDVLSKRLP